MQFVTDVRLANYLQDAAERAVVFAPFWHTLIVFCSIAFAAFALHIRLLWCRVQPLLVFFLLVSTLALRGRRRQSLATYYKRKALSSYESLHVRQLRPAYELLLLAYAAWIAFGALFHEGRHAVADLAVLDGLLLPGDLGSFVILTAMRFVALLILSAASLSPHIYFNNTSEETKYRPFVCLAVYAVLLALPPEDGVPQAIGVADTVLRFAAVSIAFAAQEIHRFSMQYYAFVARLCSNALSKDVAAALAERGTPASADNKSKVTFRAYTSHANEPPLDVKCIEELPVPLTLLSLLRSAWLLTSPNTFVALAGAFFLSVAAVHYSGRWMRLAKTRFKRRVQEQRIVKQAVSAQKPSVLSPTPTKKRATVTKTVANGNVVKKAKTPPLSSMEQAKLDAERYAREQKQRQRPPSATNNNDDDEEREPSAAFLIDDEAVSVSNEEAMRYFNNFNTEIEANERV